MNCLGVTRKISCSTNGSWGKDHKPYEYGNKVSVAATAKTNIIVGVVSHGQNLHDSKTLPDILAHSQASRGKAIQVAVCDRGYQGPKTVGTTQVVLPAPPLKRDNRYHRDQKRTCALWVNAAADGRR